MTNKELVLRAMNEVFIQRDSNAVDKYFEDNYIEHGPTTPSGKNTLKKLLLDLPPNFKYEPGIIADNGEIVMIHGRYENCNGKDYIAVDIFRVNNGKIIEHWDVMQEEVATENSVNKNSMFPIN